MVLLSVVLVSISFTTTSVVLWRVLLLVLGIPRVLLVLILGTGVLLVLILGA